MKDIEEMIAVMQAYNDGKQIQIKLKGDNDKWADYTIKDTEWDWTSFDYRVKPDKDLPETWEEFCETHPFKKGETFINNSSLIRGYQGGEPRDAEGDKNLLPSKEYAEAMLALCQLIQLRDCYNEGWQPNWENISIKYKIEFYSNEPVTRTGSSSHRILTFKTEKLRDKFLENFKDLIEIAKPLL